MLTHLVSQEKPKFESGKYRCLRISLSRMLVLRNRKLYEGMEFYDILLLPFIESKACRGLDHKHAKSSIRTALT